MGLSPGTRLGVFEIAQLIGAGGMGEVYRARDTKLGREVAIKVLPEAFAQDSQRLLRFEREAQLLAALDHPNIGALYDFQEADGVHFLVMQLVEGETLADRIERGPIPMDEALPIFAQIAGALEAAHDRGIVHRDLKPANIKITSDDRVKVLDFGIAKSFDHGESWTDGAPNAYARLARRDDHAGHTDTAVDHHGLGNDRRHAFLHEPGAGARQAGRQTLRHLRLRVLSL